MAKEGSDYVKGVESSLGTRRPRLSRCESHWDCTGKWRNR
jgi:hypothetical protein